ncbi:MAG: amidohydrolase family protein [Planctomycetes bacterium]|nr:amidohydrolase family protein [Planctomycetota bacterium]
MKPKTQRMVRIVVLAIHATAFVASAQIPASSQRQPIALVNATIHPVSGPALEAATLVMDQGKIVALGTGLQIPPQALQIDLKGKHVYPGLIESHSLLGLTEIGGVDVTNDYAERGDLNPSVRAEVAVNPDSEHIPVARANGIALAAVAPTGGLIAGRSALIMTDGWTWKEMTLRAPLSMMINWPAMRMGSDDDEASGQQRDRARTRMDVLDKAMEDARAYQTALESPRTNERTPRTDVRWEALVPVLRGDLPVWIRANSLLEIEAALSWAHRHRLRAVLVGGSDAGYCTDLLRERGIPLVVTSVLSLPDRRDADFDEAFTLPRRLHEAGVKFCIAAGSASNIRNLPYHAAKAAAYGLPKDEALKAITLYPAQIMGVADRVGSLEKGKDATLIVTDGDPLEITTRVSELFIQGRRIDLANKHQRLYDKYRQRYQPALP